MDLNRATLIGRLTRDPEVRTTTSGKSVTSFSIATGRSWKDQSGVKQEKTDFHNCVCWGKLGEIAAQYLTKGKQIYLEGRIETRDWVAEDGTKKYRTEIIGENMIMLGGRGDGGAPAAGGFSQGSSPSAPPAPAEDEIKVEDIPF